MSTKTALAAVLVIGLVAFGCDNPTPTSPELSQIPQPGIGSGSIQSAPGPMAAQQGGVVKVPISGTIEAGPSTLGEVRRTPGGIWHSSGDIVETEFTGDVAGIVVFTEREHWTDDFSHALGSGPFEGEVTWNGRTGLMTGQFTAECKADSAGVPSCHGTMVGHGSGELKGVKFQFKWGGWYPFPYGGFALDPHGS